MIYQFEHEEIKACVGCPFSLYETDHMDVFVSCNLLKTIVWTNACENKDISPRCPLVAISKTENVGCWYCEGIESHGIATVKTVYDEFGRALPAYDTPYNYCSNCGKSVKEIGHV